MIILTRVTEEGLREHAEFRIHESKVAITDPSNIAAYSDRYIALTSGQRITVKESFDTIHAIVTEALNPTTTITESDMQYTRENLVKLLDRSYSLIQEPGLYNDNEQTELLNDLQEAIDAEVTSNFTWE